MAERVIVFIDAQNVYRGARDSFAAEPGHARHVHGQIDPIAVAHLLCARGDKTGDRQLSEVRVYTGRPDSAKQPRAYAAHMRQCAAWQAAGVTVVARPLRYPPDWQTVRPQEKGIDVALAIDFVAGAVDRQYDVGIIFSTDTDLRPALEYVARRHGGSPRAETAAWKAPGSNKALIVTNPRRTWCHFLDAEDFALVSDRTDYNLR